MKLKDVTEGLKDTNPCWKGYKPVGTKKKDGHTVPNCVPTEDIDEADVVSKVSAATAKDVTIDNPDGTKTVVPLGSGMLSKDEQGNLVLNKAAAAQANQQAAAGGQQQQQPIKPGQQVRVTTEPTEATHRIGAVGGTHGDEVTDTNTQSPIGGDEEHDELSKLLIKRLRKMAGLEEAEEAPPAMPDIQGLTPGQAKDLGDGEKVTLKADGTVSYSGGFGEYIYDKTGKAIRYNSPSFSGYTQSKDLTTGKVTKSYAAGPLSLKHGPDGEVDAKYDLGLGVASMKRDASGKTSGDMAMR